MWLTLKVSDQNIYIYEIFKMKTIDNNRIRSIYITWANEKHNIEQIS